MYLILTPAQTQNYIEYNMSNGKTSIKNDYIGSMQPIFTSDGYVAKNYLNKPGSLVYSLEKLERLSDVQITVTDVVQ